MFAEVFHDSSCCRASNNNRPAFIGSLQRLDSLCNIADMHARPECDNDCLNTQRDKIERITAATHGSSGQRSCTKAENAVIIWIWILKV